MALYGHFLQGVVFMTLMVGAEGLVGKRAVMAFAFLVLGLVFVFAPPSGGLALDAQRWAFLIGLVVGFIPGYGLKWGLQYQGEPLVWAWYYGRWPDGA